MNKIFLLIVLVISGILMLRQVVFASDALLLVLPTTSTSTINKIFNLSIQLDPRDNNICLVKGVLNFDNLSCQSIAVSSALMIQTSPSCTNPGFIIAVPKCLNSIQDIISVFVKGVEIGPASLSLTGVQLLGAGTELPFSLANGAYQIEEAPATTSSGTTVDGGVELFDIILGIDSAVLKKSSHLIARTQFISFGNVPTLVEMIYRIEDVGGQVVYMEKSELMVETEKFVSKDFKNLNITKGKYILILTTNYGNNVTDEFRQSFEVTNNASASGSAVVYNWLMVIVLVGGGIIYWWIKHKKRFKKYI